MYSSDGGFVGWSFSALAILSIIFMGIVTFVTFLFVYYCIFNRERIVKERQQSDMMQLVLRREAQNKRNAQAIAEIDDLSFKVVSAEEKARQEAERQKDFSPIPQKKKKSRNFKLSSAKKQDSDYDDVVSSVAASPPASKKSEASP